MISGWLCTTRSTGMGFQLHDHQSWHRRRFWKGREPVDGWGVPSLDVDQNVGVQQVHDQAPWRRSACSRRRRACAGLSAISGRVPIKFSRLQYVTKSVPVRGGSPDGRLTRRSCSVYSESESPKFSASVTSSVSSSSGSSILSVMLFSQDAISRK